MTHLRLSKLSPLVLALLASPSFAETEAAKTALAIDTLWVVLAAVLVFFMQAGFALLETGIHSEKNITNVFMKNIMDFVIATLAFFAIGFAFMFGNGSSLIGTEGWFLSGGLESFSSLDWANIPLTVKFLFQLVFAGTAATIISGAIGGRVRFTTYLWLSLVVTAFIYPILGKWVWGAGWAADLGFFDFAGSTVVHAVGGFAALAATMVVGPRRGRFDSSKTLTSYNITYAGLGTLILWLGWFGFNAGSTMGIVSDPHLVGHILLTTNLAAAAGAFTAMLIGFGREKKFDLPTTLNGALAGLVGITAGCAFVTWFGSLIIGTVAGALMVFGTAWLESRKIDDVVGAFPVHGLCGVWGTAALGLFAAAPFSGGEGLPALGLLYGGTATTFFTQFGISLLISILAFLSTYIVCLVLEKTVGLRASTEHEELGLDLAEHPHESFHYRQSISETPELTGSD
ncbi:MAG: ammonium transporter [Bacteriovoracaceae bacterium]